jgi:MGT family glycosyltransferase
VTKVLWFSIPAIGHNIPTMPVVGELRRRGVEVVYCGTDEVQAPVELVGGRFAAYPSGVLSMREIAEGTKRIVHPGVMMLRASHRLIPFAQDAIEREQPDLVVHDHMAVWAGIAARIGGRRTATTFPMIVPGERMQLGAKATARLRVSGLVTRRLMRRERAGLATELGVDAVRQLGFGELGDRCIVFVTPELNPGTAALDERFELVGPSFDERTTAVVAAFDGRVDEAGAWEAPEGDGPLVLLSLGTLHAGSERFYGEVFRAFADHPARFVLYGGPDIDRHPLAPFPPRFAVSDRFLPQIEILPHCAAFVTHGGMGSIQNAMHHGVPVVVVPQFVEQAMNGRLVAERGAGIVLGDQPPYGRVRAVELRRALDALLADPASAERARQLGEAGRRAGGYRRAADVIEGLLRCG